MHCFKVVLVYSFGWFLQAFCVFSGSAPLEINISYHVRQSLREKFALVTSNGSNENKEAALKEKLLLLKCFDDAMFEILTALKYCYIRFIQDAEAR